MAAKPSKPSTSLWSWDQPDREWTEDVLADYLEAAHGLLCSATARDNLPGWDSAFERWNARYFEWLSHYVAKRDAAK